MSEEGAARQGDCKLADYTLVARAGKINEVLRVHPELQQFCSIRDEETYVDDACIQVRMPPWATDLLKRGGVDVSCGW